MRNPLSIEIVLLAVDHLPAIHAIEQAVFADPWPASGFLEIASLSDRNWVAVSGADVVGYLITQWIVDEIHILNIAVAPHCQHHGIGGRLLEFLLGCGRDAGMRDVFLEVRPTNAAALALYERFGFARLALRKSYYPNGEDALVMHYPIDGEADTGDRSAAAAARNGIER